MQVTNCNIDVKANRSRLSPHRHQRPHFPGSTWTAVASMLSCATPVAPANFLKASPPSWIIAALSTAIMYTDGWSLYCSSQHEPHFGEPSTAGAM